MKRLSFLLIAFTLFTMLTSESCNLDDKAVSASGVSKAQTIVQTDLNGNTIEQNNIINRLKADNKPGSIKYLYVISAYSGQVLIYSTVKGKVTSSGKRLSPTHVIDAQGFRVDLGNGNYTYTDEMLGDDGTYGSSVDYVYWWDSKGVYHQQYVTGGMILHISDQPLAVKSVILNMEETVK